MPFSKDKNIGEFGENRDWPKQIKTLFKRMPDPVSYVELVNLGIYQNVKAATSAITRHGGPKSVKIGRYCYFDRYQLCQWWYERNLKTHDKLRSED